MAETERPIWVQALHGLRGEAYRVWAYLYWRQGSNEHCWPGQATIASDLSISLRHVRRIMTDLEAGGWLVVEWPNGPGRGQEHLKHYTVTALEKRTPASSIPPTKSGHPRPLLPPKADIPVPEKRTSLSPKSGHPCPPLYKEEHIQGTHTKEHKQAFALSPEGLALLAQLRTCLRSNGDCEKGLRNAAQWADSQSPDIRARVLSIAKESGQGKPPYRLWMHRLKDELGYMPPSNGRPKPRGAEPEPIGVCVGRLVAGIGRDHIDQLHDKYHPARFGREGAMP